MDSRTLGTTGWEVTEVGLGTWNIGGEWGDVAADQGREVLRTALDEKITFIDTADVYGDGKSEQLIADVVNERDAEPIVATKAGRRLDPHVPEGYNEENLRQFVERSRENLDVKTIDLLQLHCPPTEVYYQPEVFDVLDNLVAEGEIRHYGVSVEKVEEGLKAIEYPGVETVQIIFNPFRQRPAELFFREAKRRDIGVIARVPLASGLLTGTLDLSQEFPENDHRNFNIDGSAFDRGETFAGVPYDVGIRAVDELRPHVPPDLTMAQFGLRWILDHEAVSTVIPGTTNPTHVPENVAAADAPSLTEEQRDAVRSVYDRHLYDEVHHRW